MLFPKVKSCNFVKASVHIQQKYNKTSKFKIFFGLFINLLCLVNCSEWNRVLSVTQLPSENSSSFTTEIEKKKLEIKICSGSFFLSFQRKPTKKSNLENFSCSSLTLGALKATDSKLEGCREQSSLPSPTWVERAQKNTVLKKIKLTVWKF